MCNGLLKKKNILGGHFILLDFEMQMLHSKVEADECELAGVKQTKLLEKSGIRQQKEVTGRSSYDILIKYCVENKKHDLFTIVSYMNLQNRVNFYLMLILSFYDFIKCMLLGLNALYCMQ